MFKLVKKLEGFYIYRYDYMYIVEMNELALDKNNMPYTGIKAYFEGLEKWKHYGVAVFTTLNEAEHHIYEFIKKVN